MTQKLNVKRGGAGVAVTEVMDMVAVRKGAPVFEGAQPLIDMGRAARDGEASQGTFRLVDPDAEIHSTSYRLSPHALVTWTDDASGDELWLARSRISPLESGRRAYGVGGDEVEWDITVNDNNMDLRGQNFAAEWVRPAETDIERIIALQAYTLNGFASTAVHHRKTCEITCDTDTNGHLMATGAERNMPAKTYPAGTLAQEIIADCAERTGKTYAVVIHHDGGDSHDCLLYVSPLDHTTYQTAVKVSDHIADSDIDDPTAPVFPPVWDRGKGTLTENDDVLSGLVSVYGGTSDDPQSIFVHQDTDEEPYEYWTDIVFDDKSEDATEAENRANQILTAHRAPGHRTHRFSILMHRSQHALLNAGMSMQVKSAVIAGGDDLGTYVWRRITELRWENHPDPEWIWAHIDLDKPLRRRGSAGQPAATMNPHTPTPAPEQEPDTPGTTIAQWTFELPNAAGQSFDTTGTYDSNLLIEDEADKAPFGAPYSGYATASHRVSDDLPVTAGNDYSWAADIRWSQNPSNRPILITFTGSSTTITVTDGSGFAAGSSYHITKTFTAPAGATAAQIVFSSFAATFVDNMVFAGVGTPAVNDPDAVNYGDCPHDSTHFLPSDYVLCRLDAMPSALDDLTDVTAPDPADGAVLTWDATTEQWVAEGPTDDTSDAFQITAAPEGGWGRITKHNALSYNGYTYIGYVTGDDGDCKIAVVANTDPSTVIATKTLHAALEVDDHAAPQFIVRSSDHKLLAAYSAHNDTTVYTRLSTTSLDTDPDLGDGFAAEVSRDGVLGGSSYTFPSLYELTADSEIWLIYREGANAEWFRSISTDNGVTFGAPTKILTESGETPYLKAVGNGVDRIDFVSNELNPSGGDASVYHFYYTGGNFKNSAGTNKTLPIDSTKATLVADGTGSNYSFLDIAVNASAEPVIAFADLSDLSHHVYHWRRWNGSAWIGDEITEAGAGIDVTQTYSGHLALDYADPRIAYLSREIGGEWRMYRYTTADDAATWSIVQVSSDAAQNIRPMSVTDHDDALQAIWMTGTYTGFTDWDTGIWGIGTVASTSTVALDDLSDVTLTSVAAGDLLRNDGSAWVNLPIGSTGDVLTVAAGEPTWAAPATSSSGGIGQILISDSPSTPLVFADLIQNEAQDDLVYADV